MFLQQVTKTISRNFMEDFTKDLNNGSDDGLNKILWYYSMNNNSNLSSKFLFFEYNFIFYGWFDLKISFVVVFLLASFYLNTRENYFC